MRRLLPIPKLWRIFVKLDNMPEEERLRLLRPQFQSNHYSKDRKELLLVRGKLDRALRELTRREIAEELGLSRLLDPLPAGWWGAAIHLARGSPAFFRYVNANLFFGARLFAGRVAAPKWLKDPQRRHSGRRLKNSQLLALLPPPSLPDSSRSGCLFSEFFEEISEAKKSHAQAQALDFLDGCEKPEENARRRNTAHEEPQRFELWLRGLRPETSANELARFQELKAGMAAWAKSRCRFYLRLSREHHDADPESSLRPKGGWSVNVPLAARFGLADIYWIASILRADVTATAAVDQSLPSWLELLRMRAVLDHEAAEENALSKADGVLRGILGSVTALIQNAIEISSERERRAFEPELFLANRPCANAEWRQVFTEELRQISIQRHIRETGTSPKTPAHPSPTEPEDPLQKLWSGEVLSEERPRNLVGLALSGGGIRSATFGLGALQALQDLDLLRSIDYISTVSGGGFIGSWLTSNVFRTKHWLGRLTDWGKSITHLRNYSSYLSPITGILSTDLWTMWAIYARNAFLIQLTGLAWLFSLLVIAWLAKILFLEAGAAKAIAWGISLPGGVALLLAMVVTASLVVHFIYIFNPTKMRRKNLAYIWWMTVVPACLASFLAAALIWNDSAGFRDWTTYSSVMRNAFWFYRIMLVAIFAGLTIVSSAIMASRDWKGRTWRFRMKRCSAALPLACAFSALCTFAFYVQLCGIIRMFVKWQEHSGQYEWLAFVLAPSLVLFALAISAALLVGFCGRFSDEAIREWWTRLGALFTACSIVYLLITGAAGFGPLLVISLVHSAHPTLKWFTIGSSVVSTIGGLFAGNSARTNGMASSGKAKALEVVAQVGGVVFIFITVMAAATGLFYVLQAGGTEIDIGECSSNFSGCYWYALRDIGNPLGLLAGALGVALVCGLLFSFFFDINIFGLSQFYKNRIVRCYLGASRWVPGQRSPQTFTTFDPEDDFLLCSLSADKGFRGPFPIISCSLNLGGSKDLSVRTRHSSSFFMSPLWCGSDRRKIGFAPTEDFSRNITLGQATAISGAAVSPNMGYNTSPVVAFLLTMFNVRLGWWFPNPGRNARTLNFSFWYVLRELFGKADENSNFINVSDGGHFENLGIYELVRRQCRLIIAVDAECDEFYTFGSLGNVVRICESDFGAKIDIDVSSIRPQEEYSLAHASVGTITYSNGTSGLLLYIKSSVTNNEDVGVSQYRATHPSFPHETTADQFFSEDQFESYRRLARHAVTESFRDSGGEANPIEAVERLKSLLAPAGFSNKAFLDHAKGLDQIWHRFSQSDALRNLIQELSGATSEVTRGSLSQDEIYAVNQLLQFMENVFLDLRLEVHWAHPDNRGWAMLFTGWARSTTVRRVWDTSRTTYGIRFENFCAVHLGLSRDMPAITV